jgi:hypothetical protein
MRLSHILFGILAIAVSFVAATYIMNWISPQTTGPAPKLAQLPPLPPVTRNSVVIAPIAVTLTAIRDSVERAAPKNFAGKADNPAKQILSNADINWTIVRGPIAASASGTGNDLVLTTPLNGKLAIAGNISNVTGDAISNIIGGNLGKQIGNVAIKQFNANGEIRGTVGITSRPALLPNWRVEPNLNAQVNLGDTALTIGGIRVNVPAQMKPVVDKSVNEQMAALQQRIRNDPALEQAARREWAKMCRSIPLKGAAAGLPDFWLAMRPVRAVAAQPRTDARAVNLLLGVEVETHLSSTETKPNCPFPATLEIIPPTAGRVSIGVPIDVPFTEVNKIVEAQLKNRKFPEDGSGPADITVLKATVAPAGERLLISLLVNAKEKKSFFGFGAEATVHVFGRPVLDTNAQTLKLANIELAVESEAAFGLLGAAARAAIPYVEKALAERATIDLKPFAANAQQRVAAVINDFKTSGGDGVRVDAAVTSVRLASIAYDQKTLRVIAEADGNVAVTLTKIPGN